MHGISNHIVAKHKIFDASRCGSLLNITPNMRE